MKRIIWIVIGIVCLGLVSAESGEYYFEQGSYYLSVGDVENARYYFEQAKPYLYGEELSYVEDVLDTLDRIQSENTKPLLLDINWNFIGEINDEDVVVHTYYDSYGNNAVHTRAEGGMEASELESAIGTTLNSKYINGISAYEAYLTNNGINSYIVYWNCEDTMNTIFVTYSGDLPLLFDSEMELCPKENYTLYILVGLGIIGLGFVYWKYFIKKKKIKKS